MKRVLGLGLLALTLSGCATYPGGFQTKAEYDAFLERRIHDPDYELNHAELEARAAASANCPVYHDCW